LGVLNTWGIQNRRPFLKRLSLPLIEHRAVANAAAVHFTSEQERCEAELVLPGLRSIVIPNPVAPPTAGVNPRSSEFRTKHPELAGRRVILFLSRLDPKKGLDLLLDGFAMLQPASQNAVLLIAGDGEKAFVERLRNQVQRLGIERNVIWAGFLEGEMKRAAFSAADVFVLPSYSENFGIAVVEAMASGLPVIVSDQVGIQREVAQASAGVVVGCSASEVSKAIQQLLSDNAARNQMGKNALQLAKEFSPSAVAVQLLRNYELIVRNSHPNRRWIPGN
jgi:glycosyltransferase involved in cell wall biosynthesis